MSEIKYTTDGKKVVVIGDLNQTEKIVQEIFITEDGAEIPSGERFVVKSLHDAPVMSWKEKNLSDLEKRYEKESDEWDRKIKRVMEEKEMAYLSLSARVKWLNQVAKQPHPESLKKVVQTLALFLSNTDKWVFCADYSTWHLERFDEEGVSRLHDSIDHDYNRRRFENMRLVSIFGKSNGDFEYQMSRYSDGSGSTNTVEYFQSKEDALRYIQNRFDMIDNYNANHIKIAEKFNLKVNEEKMRKYNSAIKEGIEKNISNLKTQISGYEEELKKINDKTQQSGS